MRIIDLGGRWRVRLEDGNTYEAILPGTLDENEIGHKDTGRNQWMAEEGAEIIPEIISTRLTRRNTYEGPAVYTRELAAGAIYEKEPAADAIHEGENHAGTGFDRNDRIFLDVERTRKLTLTIDGQAVEEYQRGTVSTPYIYEVTDLLTGNHKIELVCDNSYPDWPRDAIVYSSAATDETQTNWNGLLGFLRLRAEKKVFLSKIRIYPAGKRITVHVDIDAGIAYQGVLRIQSPALEKGAELERQVNLAAGLHTVIFEALPIAQGCKYWDEYEGNLYDLRVSGDGLDSKPVAFGIRDFGDNGQGRLALNGRTIFLRSEANCCVFPETGYMPLTVDEWIKILSIYQDYGINALRFHSHCPPDAAFSAADRLGILLQPELSHWNPKDAFESEESWSYYRLELEQILSAYANHPSFVMLTFGNELQAGELGHRRMRQLLDRAKEIDPTRRYAIGSNVHYGGQGTDSESDFYTSSDYYDGMIRGTSSPMRGHINHTYPNTGTNYDQVFKEIRRKYKKPVFTFEAGQYEVLPDFDEITDYQGVTIPDNLSYIKERVTGKGLLPQWKSRVEAAGELALLAYREEVEAVLRTRELSGISMLGLQDFPGQGTALVGMLNSHLKPKPYAFARPERFRSFFRDILPLVLMDRYTYTNTEMLTAEIELANYGKKEITDTTRYELKDGDTPLITGELPAVTFLCGEVTMAGKLELPLKDIMTARKLSLTVSIGGYENEYPVWVYPARKQEITGTVIIATTWAEAEQALEKGARVLYSPKADIEHFPSSVASQFTTDFWSVGTFPAQSGCMGCLMDPDHPVFKEFPTEAHSNWQWWPMSNSRAIVLPDAVTLPIVTVIDCYARLRRLALLFEANVGNGTLMVSSMGLLEKQEYPEVRALTNSILSYMASGQFAPRQTLTPEVLKAIIK